MLLPLFGDLSVFSNEIRLNSAMHRLLYACRFTRPSQSDGEVSREDAEAMAGFIINGTQDVLTAYGDTAYGVARDNSLDILLQYHSLPEWKS